MASPQSLLLERGYVNGVAGALARNVFVNRDTSQSEVILCGANERPCGVTLEACTAEADMVRVAEAPSIVKVIFAAAATREDASGNPTLVKVGSSGYATPVTGTGIEWVAGSVDAKSDEPAASGDIGLVKLCEPYPLVNGGEAPRSFIHVGPLADQGAEATVTVKLGAPGTGRQWIPLKVKMLGGTTADATAQLKFAGSAASAATAIDGDTDITTFTDSSAAAGQAVTVDIVTAASTGDADAAVVIFEFTDQPA